MDDAQVILIAGLVLVSLAVLTVAVTTAGRDRERATGDLSRETRKRDRIGSTVNGARFAGVPAGAGRGPLTSAQNDIASVRRAPPAPRRPLDGETYGLTRRQFFNRSIVAIFSLGLAGFGSTIIAFLWPTLSGGFGSKIRVGSLDAILSRTREAKEPVYVPEGRFYLQPYPRASLRAAEEVYSGGVLGGMNHGIVALYQKCTHLGCRVPWCKASQWFECPCHGSKYNRVGEKQTGPAPRGLDHFPVTISNGVVTVNTGVIALGPAVGTDTTGQEPEGPHCA